jgi:hypothetical protein
LALTIDFNGHHKSAVSPFFSHCHTLGQKMKKEQQEQEQSNNKKKENVILRKGHT